MIPPRQRAGSDAVPVADSTRLTRTFGWKPRFTDLREIVSTAWQFEQRRDSSGMP